MDIFVRNVPANVSQRQLKAAFAPALAGCGILDYHIEPFRNHPYAKITVLDSAAGDRFLSQYGVPPRSPANVRPRNVINCGGRALRCERSKDAPSDWSLKALAREAAERAAEALARPVATTGKHQDRRRFDVTGVNCGTLEYEGTDLVFASEAAHRQAGTVYFGSRGAVLLFGPAGSDQLRIDFDYWACENVVLGGDHTPSITFTLRQSPKFYQVGGIDMIAASLGAIMLGASMARKPAPTKKRLLGLPNDPHAVTGACKVYRIHVANSQDLGHMRRLVQRTPKMPSSIAKPTRMVFSEPRHVAMRRLQNSITDVKLYGALSFHVRYQLDRLARNGRLSPLAVIALLPTVKVQCQNKGSERVAYALSRLYLKLPSAGPFVEAKNLSESGLAEQLRELCETSDQDHHLNPYNLVKRHQHIRLIHKVIITPTGTFLHGPEPEPVNRVLRKYPSHTDNFMRVVFQDEDGGSVRYDPQASQELVYHGRFKSVLDGSILIAGQGFTFLGFSHSSLRAQSCWFMAPLILDGVMMHPPMVLKQLGSFDKIRVPAKCAARIGQNFTDTNATIDLNDEELFGMDDVTHDGYEFSDGVGTISLALLHKVWRVYGTRRMLKPTALQIRFAGAKGMVSLDTRLQGVQLCLRPSMIKFEAPESWNLEICGAAFRPLPMVLNRQFIKIMEDLRVPNESFMQLQHDAVEALRCMTRDSVNTQTFLEEASISKVTQMPDLIGELGRIGIDYRTDDFLYGVVEMAVVTS